MSVVPGETIEVIAQSIGISNLLPEVLPALATDVEYRLREIMQESIKCMRHSKRTTLTAEDVDAALSIRNVEPVYGFASGDPLRFSRAAGHKDLFYIEEKDLDFKDVIDSPLPKAPLDTVLTAHWLAIEGVQPAIPENPPLEALVAPSDNKKTECKDDGGPIDLKLPVKHVLSRELQLYYDKITDLVVNKSNSVLFKEAIVSLATDCGLHPLVPYFTYFISDEVSRNLNNFPLLCSLMRLVWSLLQNSHIHIEPYLHQLMPSVMTCLVAKRLGNKVLDSHWELRDFAAKLVALVCKRYGNVYHNLQPRVTRTLLHAFLDPTKALPQHYGAIQGLAAIGPSVVSLLLLPNLETYMRLLEPEMQLDKQKNEMKRHEAWRVYGALMCAAGLCIYDQLKTLPTMLSPPAYAALKSKRKVLTSVSSNKRKISMDNMIQQQQPPQKKLVTDGAAGMQGATSGYATNLGATDGGFASTPQALSSENSQRISSRKEMSGSQAPKSQVGLNQAWKQDIDAAHLLPFLFEFYGESMLSFVPAPELLVFL
nr:transcription initiation factor TFIID subunit 6-like [Ipomoea batatas]